MRSKLIGFVAAATLTLSSGLASADSYRDSIDDTPSAGAMAFDLVVVRPVGLVATVLGAGLFVLQLPLSLIQGEPPSDPAKKLVVEPAKYTFQRPLGQME
jgi:hypothetical protein